MIETIRLSMEGFFGKFPKDRVNSHCLSILARPFYILENQVDDWEQSMPNMTKP